MSPEHQVGPPGDGPEIEPENGSIDQPVEAGVVLELPTPENPELAPEIEPELRLETAEIIPEASENESQQAWAELADAERSLYALQKERSKIERKIFRGEIAEEERNARHEVYKIEGNLKRTGTKIELAVVSAVGTHKETQEVQEFLDLFEGELGNNRSEQLALLRDIASGGDGLDIRLSRRLKREIKDLGPEDESGLLEMVSHGADSNQSATEMAEELKSVLEVRDWCVAQKQAVLDKKVAIERTIKPEILKRPEIVELIQKEEDLQYQVIEARENYRATEKRLIRESPLFPEWSEADAKIAQAEQALAQAQRRE